MRVKLGGAQVGVEMDPGSEFVVDSPNTYRERLEGVGWCQPNDIRVHSVDGDRATVVEYGTDAGAVRPASVATLEALVEEDVLYEV